MRIEMNGIDVDCVIGELPEERLRRQRLRVDVSLEITDEAADTDLLADTVDYAATAERIRAALVAAECRMIERAAKVVAGACRENAKVKSVRAKVTKFGAIPHLESASAVWEG